MNISQLSPSVNRIEFEDGGRTTIVEFDERHIYVSRRKWHIELGTTTRLLHQLSKTISPASTNEPSAANEVRGSWLWLLGAIVVYFSNYSASIPLLAPALGLVWLVKFSLNIRAAMACRQRRLGHGRSADTSARRRKWRIIETPDVRARAFQGDRDRQAERVRIVEVGPSHYRGRRGIPSRSTDASRHLSTERWELQIRVKRIHRAIESLGHLRGGWIRGARAVLPGGRDPWPVLPAPAA